MLALIIRRLAGTVVVAFAVSTLVFLTLYLSPGDPALIMAGPNARPETVAQIRRSMGLDQPVYVQYGHWLGRALRGDLGRSIRTNRPVTSEVVSRFPTTVLLALLSLAWGIAIGLPSGIVAAWRKGSVVDSVLSSVAMGGLSTPAYALGMVLILAFGVYMPILPIAGLDGSFFSLHGFRYFLLPSATLGAGVAATIAKLTRNAFLDEMPKRYVATARAKGQRERVVLYQHILKNALLPVMTMTGLQFGFLLGGTVTVETVFAFPGMGKLLMDAILARDMPMIQGAVLIFAVAFVLVNLAVDVALTWANPRVRVQ